MTNTRNDQLQDGTRTFLVPEYQHRRYLVHHVVEARSREEAQCKVLDGDAALSGEQLLSTTHVSIDLDEIVDLS